MPDRAPLQRTRTILFADPAGVLRARYQPAGTASSAALPRFSEWVFAVDEQDRLVDESVDRPGTWPGWNTGFRDLDITIAGESPRQLAWRGDQDCVFASIIPGSSPLAGVAPRQVLAVAESWLRAAGVVARVGFELEFTLRSASGSTTGAAQSAYGIGLPDEERRFFEALVPALSASAIGVDSWCREGGADQWEIALSPADPSSAAECAVLARLAIQEVAAQHDLLAAFDPQPIGGFGSGLHAHLSLTGSAAQNLLHVGRLGTIADPVGSAALAGVLEIVVEATALLSPSVASYLRFVPHSAAGTTATWASDSRSVGIRHIERGDDTRVEVRVASSDADPFLLVAVLLAGAAGGIVGQAPLPPATLGDAYSAASSDRTVPTSLGDAAELLAASSLLRAAFGDAVVEHYATLARWRATQN